MQRHAIQIPISYYIWDWKILIINFYFFSRIVRNKAAERAKGSSSGPGSNSICGASSPVSQTISAASVGMTQSSMVLDNRPSYSINGILGIPQQDANANINKRKREDEGKTKIKRFFLKYPPSSGIAPCVGTTLEVGQVPHTCQALPCGSRAGADLG